ncbi:MAG: PAS domain S-box protein [Opitutus sp.]|nr:PAS domain S-box protein [Opitutus sp.]MCS6275815.1 PAS domain S-box protein [Opitutus sp.]
MQIAGSVTLSVGALILAGWAAGIEGLITFGFQGKPMTANTAIGFMLCGAAMLGFQTIRKRLCLATPPIIFALVALALAALGEQASDLNLGIDELLFHDPYTIPPLAPGHMAPNAAAGFILTAAALWLLRRPHALERWRPWLLGGLGFSVAMLGTAAVLGYLTGFRGFYSWWQLRAMSVPTSLLFMLQGVTIIGFTFGETGVRWLLGRWLLGGMALGLAFIVAAAVYSRSINEQLSHAAAGVAHTLKIEAKIRQLETAIEGKTVSLQGYIQTDNATLLQRTTQSLSTIRSVLAELRGLAADNAELQTRLDRTEQLINERGEFINRLITGRQSSARGAPAGPDPTLGASLLGEQIRAQLEDVIAYADRLLASQQARAALLRERSSSILPIEILLMTLLTITVLLRLNAEAAEHARHVDQLILSEGLKTSILNSMPSEIALLNPAGVIVAVNEPWLRFARERGAPAESRIGVGANYLDVCSKAIADKEPYAAEARTGIQDVLHGTRAEFQLEYPCPSPTQSYWYLLHATSLQGGVGGALVAHLDITARKQAEEALHKSEAMYRSLLFNLEAGIVVHAPDTSIVMNNTKAAELLGLSDDQLRGKRAIDPAWQFTDKNNTPLTLDHYPVNQVLSTKKPIKNQILGIHRPGETKPVWVLVNGFPERDDQGNITEILISFIDITARKEAEAQIRVLNAELEQRVADRTAELNAANTNIQQLNADLTARASKLEVVNKELESFSYSVSHDLRAPLRAIDGYARMAIEDCAGLLDANGRRQLNVIRDEAQRMSRLIDDLLSFSRISRQQTEPVSIDMHAMAQDVYNELIKLESGRTVQVNLQELPAAEGTPAMIRQVWVNLISNALKFTRKRPVATIEIGAQVDANGEWVYHVKDNGAGFDMRHVDKLFGVFQRLHNQPDFEGTGVGLALVQRILQRHGGRIWAEAEVDKGACFYFTLPLPTAAPVPAMAMAGDSK